MVEEYYDFCPTCDSPHGATDLYCRTCLGGLPAWPGYVDDNFQLLRECAIDEDMPPCVRAALLGSFEAWMRQQRDSVQPYDDEDARDTSGSLEQYEQAVGTLLAACERGDRPTVVYALGEAEAANHRLNGLCPARSEVADVPVMISLVA